MTLLLAQATPDSVRLLRLQCVLAADVEHRTLGTDLLRSLGTPAPGPAPLTFRMEELVRVHVSTQSVELPLPVV